LIAQGVPSAQACRTVSVNPRTLKRWRHGRTITSFVADRLDKWWSHAPRREFPMIPRLAVPKTIYQAIYRPELGGLQVPRTGRRRRKPHRCPDDRRHDALVKMTMIDQRPASVMSVRALLAVAVHKCAIGGPPASTLLASSSPERRPEALCVLADVVDAVVGGETLRSVHTWMAPNGTTLSTLTINQMTAVSLRRWRGSASARPVHGS
jgi:hypothetical protein